MAIVELLLAAAPTAAAHAGEDGALHIHRAAAAGKAGTVGLLVAAAPATAAALTTFRQTPLHWAASHGDAETAQLLLDAAPETALVEDDDGWTPLHLAAGDGHTAAIQRVLAAVPEAAEVRSASGRLPLDLALMGRHSDAARCLLVAGPSAQVLTTVARNGRAALPYLTDCVIQRLPLSEAEWMFVPEPCPGLGRALPAALAHSSAQAGRVVERLPRADARRLHTFALCLARVQRRLDTYLPTPVNWLLLSNFDP
jgi:hypothetical protein